MTGRMWVRTVDQIVQYTPEEGAATGRTVLTARRHDRHLEKWATYHRETL